MFETMAVLTTVGLTAIFVILFLMDRAGRREEEAGGAPPTRSPRAATRINRAGGRPSSRGDFHRHTATDCASLLIGRRARHAQRVLSGWLLLTLIGAFTNLFFFQRLSTARGVTRRTHTSARGSSLVPVAGALIIGLMARYGSERIRGHGIPEAIEAILINGSRVEPKVALLKPLSSAISIGSGGPFGAEGPIIMTGGAFGSLIAQFFHLTSAERKTLLVAGAAAGMSATFAAPLAAVLLAVELLLFEWKPRSFIPVALASATAAATRRYIIGIGPLFPVPAASGLHRPGGTRSAASLAGLAGGRAVGAAHAGASTRRRMRSSGCRSTGCGGRRSAASSIGVGGLDLPAGARRRLRRHRRRCCSGDSPARVILGVLLVKSIIWSVSLGSGTSGGVLAPLLMMGGALGGVEALVPARRRRRASGRWSAWARSSAARCARRSPAIVFALELTHDVNTLLPLLVAVTIAHAFTVLVLRRSILTEKVARRGFHLTREYESIRSRSCSSAK